jgi:hypothetical protein
MKYQEIKKEKEDAYNRLMDTCDVFWAFSNTQFEEGRAKHPLQEGEKYVSIGAGGYMPKRNTEALSKGIEQIEENFKRQIKEAKAREEHIIYELNNHECYYTGDITPAVDALGEDYTAEEVIKVMNEHKNKKYPPCNVCGKPSQYGGCENCYYNTVGINEKVELGEKINN